MQPQAIKVARVVDGTGRAPMPGAVVVIADGRIAAVRGPGETTDCAPDLVWDVPDGTLLPGLIDLHVHFTFDAGEQQVLLAQTTDDPDDYLLLRAARNAEEALRSGVTTVRDCGARGDLAHRLKRAIQNGVVSGPRLLVAGRPVTTLKGHCWFLGGGAADLHAAHRLIDEELERGADFIKIMATGGGLTPGSDPRRPQFSTPELLQLVAHVHAAGKRVAAHAHATAGIAACLEAGVDTIEHATFLEAGGPTLDGDVARRFAAAPTYAVSTLVAIARLAEVGGDSGLTTPAEPGSLALLEGRLEVVRGLLQAGTKVAAGSDAGVSHTRPSAFVDEPGLLARAGMAPLTAIRAATLEAARAAGVDELTGSIEPGKSADLLIVRGDPSVDLTALRRPIVVLKQGAVAWSERRP